MAYCRWSSDYGECDVYVYADVNGGWTTHVAGRKLKHKVPDHIKAMPTDTAEGFLAAYEAERKWRESLPCDEIQGHKFPKDSEYEELTSPYAGESFHAETAEACARWLIELRKSGLIVPQYAIDALINEEPED